MGHNKDGSKRQVHNKCLYRKFRNMKSRISSLTAHLKILEQIEIAKD